MADRSREQLLEQARVILAEAERDDLAELRKRWVSCGFGPAASVPDHVLRERIVSYQTTVDGTDYQRQIAMGQIALLLAEYIADDEILGVIRKD